ncbi:hypothetical protein DSM106972_025350 [Dulcicalothrix desertica PCC 7102]|uniref:Uncharacterized protein n=1 Tax=Dulcicalothrix desertica PCC 7102 TaxID=232991 RepID=A0A433VME1_9CYAN|nr:hypothetical protein [Dulcicalothrix desertica]RUT07274.1 hypothetical protein DSM106972_025350 [Dulcicalothrix desertica PCC 7102]TWH55522.1 hypothetical protein CAL7102_03666 [Dulcicalothrix desertica PCC 7102]
MQSANIVKTINVKINSGNGNEVISLFDNSLNAFSDVIAKSAFVKNLKAFSKISSLPAVRLPNFRLEDSESEKLYKALDIEFGSPRKQLDIFIGSANDWSQIGSISLLNPSGYPYRMYNLLDFATDGLAAELEDGKSIGVQIIDVGYGGLQGNDTITIHGSVTQEYVIPEKKNKVACSPINKTITIASQIVVSENEDRQYVLLQNEGSQPITVSFGVLDFNYLEGVVIKPNGHYEFTTKDFPFFGNIYAIADIDNSSQLVGTECNYVLG